MYNYYAVPVLWTGWQKTVYKVLTPSIKTPYVFLWMVLLHSSSVVDWMAARTGLSTTKMLCWTTIASLQGDAPAISANQIVPVSPLEAAPSMPGKMCVLYN